MAASPAAVGSRSHRAVLLTVTCLGQFMVLLDNTIVGAALPDMQHGLHIELTGLQWIVDAYVLLVAMLLLSGGVFADRFGRKRVYLTGVAVFTAASALCALAPSLGWLIVGRVLQGVGAAALSPASLALLAAAYPVPQERVKAIGLWAGLSGIGLAAGPVAGGALTDAFGWPAIFLVNLPIGVILLVAGVRSLDESRNPKAPAIDVPGTVLSVLGVGTLTYGLIEGGARGWTSPLILGGFTAGALLLAAFVAVEARRSAPMLPLRLFRERLFTVSNTAMVVVGFALMGSSFFFSQFFVYVQGSSILRAGLQTLPMSLAMVVVSPYAGRLAARYGFRVVVTAGLALAGLGLLALGAVHADTGYGTVWWRLAVVGTGFALTMSPLTGAAIQAVSAQEGGLASGISSTTRQIGAVLGVALLGAVVRTRQSGGASFEAGLDSAFTTAGAVTLATAVFTGLWLAKSRPAATATIPEPATASTPSALDLNRS
ncbi:DHA2 family methylenomycin A resistance protein-like MFS transporter [Streptomyces sp. KhCrAH-43]|uniref:MFS transporter n=1 Tax=unclassified Streptomyces TaxID=2593676 RepID=UPI000372A6E0|nr:MULTISPECIES: MFS transporter [unclassified Streptomyces]MYS39604.1 DHA2 family efflux MFS transporter permease subunit [Streptomyces sp. SID4920]MYX70499.1 DHA2 family efflux MFS transporter permease subunit [Streptomyces sp. SID8373]RAJ48884.1 DHA2 family methylenomycin A resistance protein-like MFS transporter [Streptomyces sp. KhCrAH-43]